MSEAIDAGNIVEGGVGDAVKKSRNVAKYSDIFYYITLEPVARPGQE